MNTGFPHSYECERLRETGSSVLSHYYYPGASITGGHDGLLAVIRPEKGEPWIGTFAFGNFGPGGVSGIFTMPDGDRLCVVAKGAGYIVSANAPAKWELVSATPVTDVRSIRALEIIVFASFTGLIAYGAAGLKWRTRQLAWDGLKITEVTDALIRGEFWDVRSEATAGFEVDLATGAHQGGVHEPQ